MFAASYGWTMHFVVRSFQRLGDLSREHSAPQGERRESVLIEGSPGQLLKMYDRNRCSRPRSRRVRMVQRREIGLALEFREKGGIRGERSGRICATRPEISLARRLPHSSGPGGRAIERDQAGAGTSVMRCPESSSRDAGRGAE